MGALSLIGGLFLFVSVQSEENLLPYPSELKIKVEFWKAIYTKYTTRQGVLHDANDLSIIYEAIEIPRGEDLSAVSELKTRIREQLFNILRKNGRNLTLGERQLLSRFPGHVSRARLMMATENVRFQLGQMDRFRDGIIRSAYYLPYIEKILREEGIPDFFKYLPHVESSFQEYAISKFGAAGLWQLMPETAEKYLRINYAIDERLDPWKATRAAAKFIRQNQKILKTWPLTITAYNHGADGILKAVQLLKTTDMAHIAFYYQSPRFGFASRNFYTQFLAAKEVAENYRKYFGELKVPLPLRFEEMIIKNPIYFSDVEQDYQLTLAEFKKLNPGLRPPVLENRRPIPQSTLIRVPFNSKKSKTLVATLSKKIIAPLEAKIQPLKTPEPLPQKAINKYQVFDLKDHKGWIEIALNETISEIAHWLGVDMDQVRKWNDMSARSQVRLSQKLIIYFPKTSPETFETTRREYHSKIREDFFSQFEVRDFMNYQVSVGENLWSICYQKFDIPPWLLAEYNPTVTLNFLSTGVTLKIPMVYQKQVVQ